MFKFFRYLRNRIYKINETDIIIVDESDLPKEIKIFLFKVINNAIFRIIE
jgi:hypothetical protein